MRSAKVWVPLAILLALVIGVSAQAGGKGAVKVELFEGHVDYSYDPPRVYPNDPPVVAGFVVFDITASGKLEATVKLNDGAENTTFEVTVVPQYWGDGSWELKTNGKGKGTAHVSVDVPENYTETINTKVSLWSDDYHYATQMTPLKVK